jgi:hypothetical protein
MRVSRLSKALIEASNTEPSHYLGSCKPGSNRPAQATNLDYACRYFRVTDSIPIRPSQGERLDGID